MIYTDKDAVYLKKDSGKKWRPSNSTEGMMFENALCANCKNDQMFCAIKHRVLAFQIDDEHYPTEWIIGADGQPTCAAYEERSDV